jgi:hypothetical protein
LLQEIDLVEATPVDFRREFMGLQFKERFRLLADMLDWDHWGQPSVPTRVFCPDGHFAEEHFCQTTSELGALLSKVYFPKIRRQGDGVLKAET